MKYFWFVRRVLTVSTACSALALLVGHHRIRMGKWLAKIPLQQSSKLFPWN